MDNLEKFELLAKNLACPSGEKGIDLGHLMYESNIGMIHNTIKLLNLKPNEQILELGPGNGQHILDLISKFPNLQYRGLDISQTMVEQIEILLNIHAKDLDYQIQWYEGKSLPFNPSTFDKIMTINTIYFWDSLSSMFVRLFEVLKPQGQLNIGYAQKSFMENLPFTPFGFSLYEDETIIEQAKLAGFTKFNLHSFTERIRSKADEWVERPYSVLQFYKPE